MYRGTDRDGMTRQVNNAGERVGNAHSTTRTFGVQAGGTVELRSDETFRTGTPDHIGVLGVRAGATRQHNRSNGTLSTAGREDATATPAGVHSFRATGRFRAELVGAHQWHAPFQAVTLGRAGRKIHEPATVGGPGATLGEFSVQLHLSEQHMPKLDPHAEGAVNPYASGRPTTSEPLTGTDDLADDLWAPSEWQRGDSLRNIPVVTLFVPTDEHILAAGPLVADRATRGEWSLTTPGTSQHQRMRNAFGSTALTSDADQVFSPMGKHLDDLRAPGFLYGATGGIRLVGRRGNPTAVSGPVDLKPEQNKSLDLAVSGGDGKGWVLSFDLTAGHFPAQDTPVPTTTRYGFGFTPYQRSSMTSKGGGRTTSRSVNVVPENGRWVPVTADAEYRFEMSGDKLGVLTPFRSKLPAWTGQLVNKANAWRGLVSEQAAHALNLFDTGIPKVAALAEGAGTWSHHAWFKESPLGVVPVSAPSQDHLNRAQLMRTLRGLRFTRNSLESVRTLLSERHGQAMIESGIPQQYRGRAPWRGFTDSLPLGGKEYRVTVKQVPGRRTVEDFGFGDVESGQSVTTNTSASRAVTRSRGISANAAERVTGPNGSLGGPVGNTGGSGGRTAARPAPTRTRCRRRRSSPAPSPPSRPRTTSWSLSWTRRARSYWNRPGPRAAQRARSRWRCSGRAGSARVMSTHRRPPPCTCGLRAPRRRTGSVHVSRITGPAATARPSWSPATGCTSPAC